MKTHKNSITIKIAGDSGDGVQLTGHLLAMIQALFGNDVSTYSDYPAEIRAPKGTLYGVSAYQMQVGSGTCFHSRRSFRYPSSPLPCCLSSLLLSSQKGRCCLSR